MKGILYCLLSMILLGQVAQAQSISDKRGREIQFAERVVMGELAMALSQKVRNERQSGSRSCGESGTIELGIGLLGINRSEQASKALLNLLGLRLDGAGAEELSCQLLNRGNSILRPLQRLKPAEVAQNCTRTVESLGARELSDVTDVGTQIICRTPQEVDLARNELVRAIQVGTKCEW